MRRIMTAVLVFVVAGGLSLSQARAESKGDKTAAKVQSKDVKSAKVIDKMTAKPNLPSASFASECRRYCGSYYYRPYYTYTPYYSYYPYRTYRSSYSCYPYSTYRTCYTY